MNNMGAASANMPNPSYGDFDLEIIDATLFDGEQSRPPAPACHTLSSLPCCAN
ncbi:hypothetical protein GCM10012275_19700 [Longimycelium tulufanense]|uniref:Uncharacterized protein n=1 Tax=Longimycelium tulufanense TaxID=907463 RepID=A0A8J3C7E6_9PSEU|nr:nocathioamide family RiPP precursor [Longimycelium tulufanense]GGM48857.1 hypothetical protein GCM10012275_19700 [Longimycelium tulufanense]